MKHERRDPARESCRRAGPAVSHVGVLCAATVAGAWPFAVHHRLVRSQAAGGVFGGVQEGPTVAVRSDREAQGRR